MRFSLAFLIAIVAYAAVGFASVSSPSLAWAHVVRSLAGLLCATTLLIGYDRRAKPLLGFGIFCIVASVYSGRPEIAIDSPFLPASVLTDPMLGNHLAEIVRYHISVGVGFIGYLLGLALLRTHPTGENE